MPQIVMITGASSGIGKATALELLARGYTVYGLARRVEKMKDIVQAGGVALPLDVTKIDAVERCVERVVREQGRIDVLVNNAGFGLYGPVEEVPLAKAQYQYDVNLFGVARMTQLVLPHMRRTGQGRIINISSIGGVVSTPLGAWYHSTKFALEGWSDCVRQEVKRFGIDVVVIRPGLIATEFGEVMVRQEQTTRRPEHPTQESPYAPLLTALHKQGQEMFSSSRASDPQVIADVVVKAIVAKRPRTRYRAGHLSGTLLCVRRLLPDRWWDALVLAQLR